MTRLNVVIWHLPMRYVEVAENVKALVRDSPSPEEFVYAFLLAYGTPNASIAHLKSGQMNLAKAAGEQELTPHVMEVLQQRENHPEKTMAQLYDPDKMPAGLGAAHHQLDLTVDRLYRKFPLHLRRRTPRTPLQTV